MQEFFYDKENENQIRQYESQLSTIGYNGQLSQTSNSIVPPLTSKNIDNFDFDSFLFSNYIIDQQTTVASQQIENINNQINRISSLSSNARSATSTKSKKSSRSSFTKISSNASNYSNSDNNTQLVLCLCPQRLFKKKNTCMVVMTKLQHKQHVNGTYMRMSSEKSLCAKALTTLQRLYPQDNIQAKDMRICLCDLENVEKQLQLQLKNSNPKTENLIMINTREEIIEEYPHLFNQNIIKYLHNLSDAEFIQIQEELPQDNTLINESQQSNNVLKDNSSQSFTDEGLEMLQSTTGHNYCKVDMYHTWIKSTRKNGNTQFKDNIPPAFLQLCIPLEVEETQFEELTLQEIFSKCHETKSLTFQELSQIDYDDYLGVYNPLTEEEKNDLQLYFQKNELNKQILKSIQKAIYFNKTNIQLHVFFWDQSTMKPVLHKYNGEFCNHTHEDFKTISWDENGTVFIINSGDTEFNKFTLYKAADIKFV